MKANRAERGRHSGTSAWLITLTILWIGGCADAGLTGPIPENTSAFDAPGTSEALARVTGSVDLVWPGGKGANAPDDDRIAQAEVAGFEGIEAGHPGSGTFFYRVVASDGTLHREIGVRLTWVGRDPGDDPGEVRFVGTVISDTKPCGGSGHGGPGGGGHDEGGCSHKDGETDDGGCSHDDGDTHDEGGCSHDDEDPHDDGGCSGTDDHGGIGGTPGPGGPGNKVTGQNCRLGQFVIGWVKDAGTPAREGDRISWKWMSPEASKALAIQAAISTGAPIPWPCHLCEKEILGGNLRVSMLKN